MGAVGIGVVIRGLYYWNQRERERLVLRSKTALVVVVVGRWGRDKTRPSPTQVSTESPTSIAPL